MRADRKRQRREPPAAALPAAAGEALAALPPARTDDQRPTTNDRRPKIDATGERGDEATGRHGDIDLRSVWKLREWWLPKEGNSVEEYEDAFATRAELGRFAVSDGATETSFSGRWASLLVNAFVEAPPAPEVETDTLTAWLQPLQEAWHASVPWDRLPWYGLEKARAGAFASLLGFVLSTPAPFPSGKGEVEWRASGAGDSVLLQVRAGELLRTWPVSASSELGSRPYLLTSLPGRERVAQARWTETTGEAAPGDRFLMTTDALAHWILTTFEAGERPWERLWEIADAEAFAGFVDEERAAHRMRNDDVTLVAFEVPPTRESGAGA
jgi:hypothetical protein